MHCLQALRLKDARQIEQNTSKAKPNTFEAEQNVSPLPARSGFQPWGALARQTGVSPWELMHHPQPPSRIKAKEGEKMHGGRAGEISASTVP